MYNSCFTKGKFVDKKSYIKKTMLIPTLARNSYAIDKS